MAGFTASITEFIQRMSSERLSEAAVNAAKRSIIDCLGVAVAGSEEDAGRILSEYVRDAGKSEAGVIGSGFKTSMEQAAWVNGTKAHALDYDDYFATKGSTPYHPTVAIMPAILAVGEKLGASGQEVLLAYITGFEVEARVAAVCAEPQYNLGWHTTSTLGSLGAVAAVAKLLRLDKPKTRIALGIAGSLASGLRRNFGTMSKPLHAGNAARNGVVAALLAQRHFTADIEILDGSLGFSEVLSGRTAAEAEDRKPEAEFYIVSPGVALKPYPSCAYTHWAIDAALDLKRRNRITPSDIVDVECRTSSGLPKTLIHSRPRTALEGKFSLEFCVAAALVDGEVSLKQFTDKKVTGAKVQELIRKVKYVHPPEMGSGLVDLQGELVVKLKDGKVCSQRVSIAKGSSDNPLSQDELVHKYRDCVRFYLPAVETEKSLELLLNLESLDEITELTDILTFKAVRGKVVV